MKKTEITEMIEKFAPLQTQESWDCSGWLVKTDNNNINKVLLCLTVTDNIVKQAEENHCDMIISHHPLFTVPIKYRNIDIYCAHTNLDKASGGTTDTLISSLGLTKTSDDGDFLRYANVNCGVNEFLEKLRSISPNLRYVNNNNTTSLKKVAFCAGSGSEFVDEAYLNGADALVTGDVTFHRAIESPIVIYDIGHFESEILVLSVLKNLIHDKVNVLVAAEHSPFI
ncbi:Nif3-like dinuclear metal center hexameric protein [bacterium]|nr:Nif3-like dinuclear metal center hexameric protein [bacterium]